MIPLSPSDADKFAQFKAVAYAVGEEVRDGGVLTVENAPALTLASSSIDSMSLHLPEGLATVRLRRFADRWVAANAYPMHRGHQLAVFEGNGALAGTFVGVGRGPGEVERINAFALGGDSLYVAHGGFLHTFSLEDGSFGGHRYIGVWPQKMLWGDGRLWMNNGLSAGNPFGVVGLDQPDGSAFFAVEDWRNDAYDRKGSGSVCVFAVGKGMVAYLRATENELHLVDLRSRKGVRYRLEAPFIRKNPSEPSKSIQSRDDYAAVYNGLFLVEDAAFQGERLYFTMRDNLSKRYYLASVEWNMEQDEPPSALDFRVAELTALTTLVQFSDDGLYWHRESAGVAWVKKMPWSMIGNDGGV